MLLFPVTPTSSWNLSSLQRLFFSTWKDFYSSTRHLFCAWKSFCTWLRSFITWKKTFLHLKERFSTSTRFFLFCIWTNFFSTWKSCLCTWNRYFSTCKSRFITWTKLNFCTWNRLGDHLKGFSFRWGSFSNVLAFLLSLDIAKWDPWADSTFHVQPQENLKRKKETFFLAEKKHLLLFFLHFY